MTAKEAYNAAAAKREEILKADLERIAPLIAETDKRIEEATKYGDDYTYSPTYIYNPAIDPYDSKRSRINQLNLLANYYSALGYEATIIQNFVLIDWSNPIEVRALNND